MTNKLTFTEHAGNQFLTIGIHAARFHLAADDVIKFAGKLSLHENMILFFECLAWPLRGKALEPRELVCFIQEIVEPPQAVIEGRSQVLSLFQAQGNRLQQLQPVKRLYDIIISSHGHAFPEISFFRFGGQENERDIRSVRMFGQNVEYTVTIQLGHHNVAQYQIRLMLESLLYPRFTIEGR